MTGWDDGTFSGAYTHNDSARTRTATVDYGAFTRSYTYEYDLAGRVKKFTGPDGKQSQYAYTPDNMLLAMDIPGQGTIGFATDARGRPVQTILPGGSAKHFAYNPQSALVTNVAVDPAGNPVMARAYQRNALGNILGQDSRNAPSAPLFRMVRISSWFKSARFLLAGL